MKVKNKISETNTIRMVARVFLVLAVICVKLEFWKQIYIKNCPYKINCNKQWGYIKYGKYAIIFTIILVPVF